MGTTIQGSLEGRAGVADTNQLTNPGTDDKLRIWGGAVDGQLDLRAYLKRSDYGMRPGLNLTLGLERLWQKGGDGIPGIEDPTYTGGNGILTQSDGTVETCPDYRCVDQYDFGRRSFVFTAQPSFGFSRDQVDLTRLLLRVVSG